MQCILGVVNPVLRVDQLWWHHQILHVNARCEQGLYYKHLGQTWSCREANVYANQGRASLVSGRREDHLWHEETVINLHIKNKIIICIYISNTCMTLHVLMFQLVSCVNMAAWVKRHTHKTELSKFIHTQALNFPCLTHEVQWAYFNEHVTAFMACITGSQMHWMLSTVNDTTLSSHSFIKEDMLCILWDLRASIYERIKQGIYIFSIVS